MTEWTYEYFRVIEAPPAPGRSTRKYDVVNIRQGSRLGGIFWHSPWRQFVFEPQRGANTIWSSGCLEDIQNAIRRAKERYDLGYP